MAACLPSPTPSFRYPSAPPAAISSPADAFCGREDGRVAVLGAIQPRALCRGMPASRWCISAKPHRTSTPTRSSAATLRWRGWSTRPCRDEGFLGRRRPFSLADVSLLAYTRLAHEGGFHLDGYAAVRRWIGEAERSLGLPPARLRSAGIIMGRKFLDYHPPAARRDDVGVIVAMLADDPLGSRARNASKTRCPAVVFSTPFEAPRQPIQHIQLVVAEDGTGAVVGCLQLCILPGLSSAGAPSRGPLIEGCPASPTHCRSRGIGERMVQWAIGGSPAPSGCKLVETVHP